MCTCGNLFFSFCFVDVCGLCLIFDKESFFCVLFLLLVCICAAYMIYACVCVCEREREKERVSNTFFFNILFKFLTSCGKVVYLCFGVLVTFSSPSFALI